MTEEHLPYDEPCYVISVAARLVSLHPQTLRYYDRLGLIEPSRTAGRIRLYSRRDIDLLRRISRLTEDLGVNLAGVEVILNMSSRMQSMQQRLAQTQREAEAQIRALRARVRELEEERRGSVEEAQVINVSAREISLELPKEDTDDRG